MHTEYLNISVLNSNFSYQIQDLININDQDYIPQDISNCIKHSMYLGIFIRYMLLLIL